MKIVTREQWGARPPKSRSLTSRQNSDTLHHTTGLTLGSRTSGQWVRNIQDYHMDHNKWADIGYNWLVDGHGTIFEGRGDGVVGAHARGFNSTYRGIAYLGDATSELPEAARVAIKWLVGSRDVVGHRDLAATACPGNTLYAWMRAGMPLVKKEEEVPVVPDTLHWVLAHARYPKARALKKRADRMHVLCGTRETELSHHDLQERLSVVSRMDDPVLKKAIMKAAKL